MEEKLLAYLARNPRSSFSEIEALFKREGYDYRGKCAMVDMDKNILIWVGWNENAISLVYELSGAGKIVFHPASWADMMRFRESVDLPVARKLNHRYKKLHWLPTVVSAVENQGCGN